MNKYAYDGPVMHYDMVVDKHWKAETMAVSVAKARSNMTYVYKKKHGYSPDAAVTLPGNVRLVN